MAQPVVNYPRLSGSELVNIGVAETNSGNPQCKADSPRDEHCYNYHLNERVNCNMGPDHVPIRGSPV